MWSWIHFPVHFFQIYSAGS